MTEPGAGGRRVCLVVATTTGGTGRHVRVLVDALLRRGAHVLVCGPADTDVRFGFSRSGAVFHPVPIGSSPRPRADQRTVRILRNVARGCDVVHAHGLRAGLLAGLGTRRPTPFVVTLHNASLSGGGTRLLVAGIERYVVRRADLVFAVSPDLAARARRRGGRDVRLAPVSAPLLPPPTRSRASMREELQAGDRPLVLSVGRLAAQKGYPWLVDAAAQLTGHRRAPLFLVAGEGPLRSDLEERIARTDAPVRLLGWRDDTADLLNAADIVAVPSQWEGSSLAVQEALRAGVPLVATTAGGTPALVGEGGLLTPARDSTALATAISTLLDDEQAYAARCSAAHQAALRLPTDESVGQQVLAGYAGLWSQAPRRS